MIIEQQQQSIVTSTSIPTDTPATAGAGREVIAVVVEGISSVGVGEISRCVVW